MSKQQRLIARECAEYKPSGDDCVDALPIGMFYRPPPKPLPVWLRLVLALVSLWWAIRDIPVRARFGFFRWRNLPACPGCWRVERSYRRARVAGWVWITMSDGRAHFLCPECKRCP